MNKLFIVIYNKKKTINLIVNALAFFLSITDERDAIQKKTFTKWVNKHLKKVRFHGFFFISYIALNFIIYLRILNIMLSELLIFKKFKVFNVRHHG